MKFKKHKSTTFLCAATFLVFVFIYLVTPPIYNKVLTNKYETREAELLAALKNNNDVETLMTRYAIENNAYIEIQGDTTHLTTPEISSIGEIETMHNYSSPSGESMTLHIQYANNAIVDLNKVQMIVLPIMAILLMVLIGLLQYFNKGESFDDYMQLRKVTTDMLRMKNSAHLPTSSGNKNKDVVAKNINELYDQFLMSINAVKQQVDDKVALENQLLDILKQKSNNTSKALDEVIEMLSKMALDEGKYRNHYLYLIDAKVKLEDLQQNLKQDINLQATKVQATPIDIEEYLKNMVTSYELLLLRKRMSFKFNFNKSFKTPINDLLFKKCFEEMMAFILLQCDEQSVINISQNNYDIHIAYKGACLTAASISEVKKQDAHIQAIYNYTKQMGLFVDFEEAPKKDGMQFVIHF